MLHFAAGSWDKHLVFFGLEVRHFVHSSSKSSYFHTYSRFDSISSFCWLRPEPGAALMTTNHRCCVISRRHGSPCSSLARWRPGPRRTVTNCPFRARILTFWRSNFLPVGIVIIRVALLTPYWCPLLRAARPDWPGPSHAGEGTGRRCCPTLNVAPPLRAACARLKRGSTSESRTAPGRRAV